MKGFRKPLDEIYSGTNNYTDGKHHFTAPQGVSAMVPVDDTPGETAQVQQSCGKTHQKANPLHRNNFREKHQHLDLRF